MIGIVILNYKSYSDTIALVSSLQKQTIAGDLHIVIVDNCSPNNSYQELKPLEKDFPNVIVVQTGENIGYARGNNVGLKYLDEHIKPEYMAILNNDIELPEDCFEKLVQNYDQLEDPAIIAPTQLDQKGAAMQPYKLNTFPDDCLNMFTMFKLFGNRNKLALADNTGKGAMKVEMIHGSFMFSSLEKFRDIGFFYPGTFLYAEERFIAEKVKEKGWKNYILLEEYYVHAHSRTIDSAFDQIGKYRILYDSWIEFTKVCRTNGNLKASILKVLSKWSLFEMRIIQSVRNLFV